LRTSTATVADIEWAELKLGGTLHIGSTTGSGATVSAAQGFAGGGSRSFVVGKLSNGVVAAITSEGRDSPLWSFVDCRLREMHGRYDRRAGIGGDGVAFYSVDDAGAAGCPAGHLEGFHLLQVAPGQVTITAERVEVSRDGLHATVAGTTTVLEDAEKVRMADDERIRLFTQTSCGHSPVLRPIYRAHS
jgi:hypothetical protein